MSSISRQPMLRLVAEPGHDADLSAQRRQAAIETRLAALRSDLDPSDPRWVLALRTKHQLQGAALNPQRRDKLLKLANRIGLRSFDANMVIAIVQDEARRIAARAAYGEDRSPANRRLHPDTPGSALPRLAISSRVLADRIRVVPRPQPTNRRADRIGQLGSLTQPYSARSSRRSKARTTPWWAIVAAVSLSIFLLSALIRWVSVG